MPETKASVFNGRIFAGLGAAAVGATLIVLAEKKLSLSEKASPYETMKSINQEIANF